MTEDNLDQNRAALILNALPNIGPVTLGRLLDAFGGDQVAVLRATPEALRRVHGVGPVIAGSLVRWRELFDLEREEARLGELGARFLPRSGTGYPPLLLEMPDGPIGLYQRGEYEVGARCVAVVGSRRSTSYGEGFTRELVGGLVAAGWCVVSGLALGIDTCAHRAALAAGGRTVAVLGCGVDIAYPAENRRLLEALVAEGAVLSEFPLGRRADRQSFAMRNRVVSGMSRAVVVVETDVDGGSMITARFAAEQGRVVLAVPGRVDLPQSRGCHELIRDGATLCRGTEDVLAEVEQLPGFALGRRPLRLDPPPAATAAPALEGVPALLWPHLEGGSACSMDDLVERTGVPAAEVAGALLWMEMSDLVAKRSDGRFTRR